MTDNKSEIEFELYTRSYNIDIEQEKSMYSVLTDIPQKFSMKTLR